MVQKTGYFVAKHLWKPIANISKWIGKKYGKKFVLKMGIIGPFWRCLGTLYGRNLMVKRGAPGPDIWLLLQMNAWSEFRFNWSLALRQTIPVWNFRPHSFSIPGVRPEDPSDWGEHHCSVIPIQSGITWFPLLWHWGCSWQCWSIWPTHGSAMDQG